MRAERKHARSRADRERSKPAKRSLFDAPLAWIRAHSDALKRVALVLFLLLVGWLIVDRARTFDWGAVWTSLRAYPLSVLGLAAALAAASHLVYACFDLIGRRVTGHALSAPQVMRVGFVSYAFNLNLGSIIGGIAVRYRLYDRLGLPAGQVTEIVGLSLVTNWLGYLALGGALFALSPLALPPGWALGSGALRVLGAVMVLAAALYVGACFRARRRRWGFRGHDLELPSGPVAVVQLFVSMLNWSLMASVVWVLLQDRVGPITVLEVLLMAAIAGVIAHVPAGLGVLEGVFLALLSHQVGHGELIAALLCYRALYYLFALAVAVPMYFWTEARSRAEPAAPPDPAAAPSSTPASLNCAS